MKITAYKCPDTFKIFEFKSDYDQHRKRFLAKRKKAQNKQKIIDSYTKIFQDFRAKVQYPVDIGPWIVDHCDLIVKHSNMVNYDHAKKNFKITNVNTSLYYNDMCGNSHCAPIGGVENWGRDTNLPLGYPGWKGRAEFEFEGDYSGFFSELFTGTRINFGSGSGGASCYYSEITLFESDWPGLKEGRIFSMLSE